MLVKTCLKNILQTYQTAPILYSSIQGGTCDLVYGGNLRRLATLKYSELQQIASNTVNDQNVKAHWFVLFWCNADFKFGTALRITPNNQLAAPYLGV